MRKNCARYRTEIRITGDPGDLTYFQVQVPSIETKSGKARRKKRNGKTSVTVETKSEEDFFEGLDVGDALEPEKIEKENEPAASNPMTMRRLWLQEKDVLFLSMYVSPSIFAPVLYMFLCIKIISYFVYAHTLKNTQTLEINVTSFYL